MFDPILHASRSSEGQLSWKLPIYNALLAPWRDCTRLVLIVLFSIIFAFVCGISVSLGYRNRSPARLAR